MAYGGQQYPPGYNPQPTPPEPTLPSWEQSAAMQYTRPPGYQDINVNTERFMNPNQSLIQQYGNLGPQYQSALQGISGLARMLQGGGAGLYNVGSQAYGNALDYYNQILSGSKAAGMRAIAPQVSQIEDVGAGAQASLEASGLRGGALDAARASLTQQKAGQIGNLIPQAQQVAAQQAGTLGLGGAQAGLAGVQGAASANQAVAGLEAQRQQTAIAQEQANRQLGASTYLQGQGLQLQDLLGMRSLDVNERLGLGQLGVEQGNQALNYWTAPQQINLGQQQLALQQQIAQWQRDQQQGSMWGGLLGNLLGMFGGGGGNPFGGGNTQAYNPMIPTGSQTTSVPDPNNPGFYMPPGGYPGEGGGTGGGGF
jgi:hypothetical protein